MRRLRALTAIGAVVALAFSGAGAADAVRPCSHGKVRRHHRCVKPNNKQHQIQQYPQQIVY